MAEDSIVQRLLPQREKLLSHIRRKIASPELAEDLLQECLLRALRSAPDLQEEERLLAWFHSILRNAITDAYRRGAVATRLFTPLDPTAEEPPAPESEGERSLCECFRLILPLLKPAEAELIESLELAGEQPAHAARRFGISTSTLKVRRHRARQSLRARLEETCSACARHGCLDCDCRNTL